MEGGVEGRLGGAPLSLHKHTTYLGLGLLRGLGGPDAGLALVWYTTAVIVL